MYSTQLLLRQALQQAHFAHLFCAYSDKFQTILHAAKELASFLQESSEFKNIDITRRKLGEDDETREILWQYQDAKKTMYDARETGRIVPDKVLKESKRLKRALNKDENMKAHQNAKQSFQNLLRETNILLSKALGGVDFGELASWRP